MIASRNTPLKHQLSQPGRTSSIISNVSGGSVTEEFSDDEYDDDDEYDNIDGNYTLQLYSVYRLKKIKIRSNKIFRTSLPHNIWFQRRTNVPPQFIIILDQHTETFRTRRQTKETKQPNISRPLRHRHLHTSNKIPWTQSDESTGIGSTEQQRQCSATTQLGHNELVRVKQQQHIGHRWQYSTFEYNGNGIGVATANATRWHQQ